MNEPRVAFPVEVSLRASWLGLVALNVACVLEPLVGVVWQACLARVAGARMGLAPTVLLGVGLWIVYAADRALDARCTRRPDTLRHAFFARHLNKITVLIASVSVAALGLGLSALSVAEWMSAGVVFATALAYLAIVHHLRAPKPLKKALAAAIFVLGVGAFVWPNAGQSGFLPFAQLAFTLLAGCNLAVISTLEVNASKAQTRFVVAACAALGGASSIAAICAPEARSLFLGVATSTVLLAILLIPSSRHREFSHALADLALVLPLLPAT